MQILLNEEQCKEYLINSEKEQQLELVKNFISRVYGEDSKTSLINQLSMLQDDLYLATEGLIELIEEIKEEIKDD